MPRQPKTQEQKERYNRSRFESGSQRKREEDRVRGPKTSRQGPNNLPLSELRGVARRDTGGAIFALQSDTLGELLDTCGQPCIKYHQPTFTVRDKGSSNERSTAKTTICCSGSNPETGLNCVGFQPGILGGLPSTCDKSRDTVLHADAIRML
jgi:hypothetical protein